MVSGLRSKIKLPVAEAIPILLAVEKPRFFSLTINLISGYFSLTSDTESSLERLSTIITSRERFPKDLLMDCKHWSRKYLTL